MTGSRQVSAPRGPLEGLRVLELARILAGPFAGQTLADLGAEVLKIESAEGDDTRRWGPPFIERENDTTAAYFHSCNRGKASEVVDLRTPEGQARVRALAGEADVLIENFKVGGLAKYGLDYASLSEVNPRLIYCSITGFGQDGPYAHRAGYDYIIQGMSGFMSITGDPDGAPQRAGVAITDIMTGLYSVSAILAALHQRDRTGRGQHIDMALLDCAVAAMANQALNYLSTGVPPERTGNYHPNLTPYQVFECADGHIIIATGNDAQFQRLCRVLGMEEMAFEPEFLTNAARIHRREEMTERLTRGTRQLDCDALLRACEGEGIPAGPINDMAAVFSDPQVVARGLQIKPGDVPGVRSPFRFSDADLVLDWPSPKLGESG
jgi:crotonobetainyl-CoA:carnitine CoA-transferase CaiB-like acyl-CoA transferase